MSDPVRDRPPEVDTYPRTKLALRVVWVLWVLGLIAFTLWAASFMWKGSTTDL